MSGELAAGGPEFLRLGKRGDSRMARSGVSSRGSSPRWGGEEAPIGERRRGNLWYQLCGGGTEEEGTSGAELRGNRAGGGVRLAEKLRKDLEGGGAPNTGENMSAGPASGMRGERWGHREGEEQQEGRAGIVMAAGSGRDQTVSTKSHCSPSPSYDAPPSQDSAHQHNRPRAGADVLCQFA